MPAWANRSTSAGRCGTVCASLQHEEEGCRDCRRCGRTSLFFSEFPDSVLQFLQSAAGERGLGEQPVELGPIQSEPLLGIHSLQFGHGTKSLVRGDRGPAVVRTGRSRKSIRAARLRLLRRARWSGARCSGKRRFSVRAEWLRQDTRRCSGGSFRSRRARSAGRRRARPS